MEILNKDYGKTIDGDLMDQAAEVLIKLQDLHLSDLMGRLGKSKVAKVLEPVIIGARYLEMGIGPEEEQYTFDLGLLKREVGYLKVANPIYAEAILRSLSSEYAGEELDQLSFFQSQGWLKGDQLDMDGILKAFQQYWKDNSGNIPEIKGYARAKLHLVLGFFSKRSLTGLKI